MTREGAKKYLELIQEFANGAEIEYRRCIRSEWTKWRTATHPKFTHSDLYEYRKKKGEPRKWYFNLYKSGRLGRLHSTFEGARRCVYLDELEETLQVCEVINED